ncbi:MAG: hypothetical protein P8M22_07600 [Phycisphaerales bacterium]|nr:hypothetical protein [Phycisphaerales bacterium]
MAVHAMASMPAGPDARKASAAFASAFFEDDLMGFGDDSPINES